jgi:DNA-binding transcriptional regulator LsrR (DeoR family)
MELISMVDAGATRPKPAASIEAAIVARRYFIEDKQKSEIADELGISRFKVARLLDEARASGIVHIHVDLPSQFDLGLGDEVARAFGIRRAIVVRGAEADPKLTASLIGSGAAQHLASVVRPSDVLGISWGSSLNEVVSFSDGLPPIDVVQLVGGASAGGMDVGGVELVRRLAAKTGGTGFPLHAPLLVRTASMAAELRNDPSLQAATGSFGRLTVALVGIGSWNPPRSSLFGEIGEEDRVELLAKGAMGDVCTFVFRQDGQEVLSPALDRTVGVSLEELRRVPEVIAVAGGPKKTAAIAAVLRSGVVNTLVTDSDTARRLLDLR